VQFEAFNLGPNGTLVVNAASGRFPDGLLFDAPLAGPTPPPKACDGAFGADQRSLLVYLGVPEYRHGARNVARVNDAVLTRWHADEELVRDETTGLMERPIQVAPPTLRLLVEGESLEGFTVMPVARVLRGPAGELSFDRGFVRLEHLPLTAPDFILKRQPFAIGRDTQDHRVLPVIIRAKHVTTQGQSIADLDGDIPVDPNAFVEFAA
jgi:hypothetical protein